jgi:hypothetical protein
VVVQTARTTTHRATVINSGVSSEAGHAQPTGTLFLGCGAVGSSKTALKTRRDEFGACAVGGDERASKTIVSALGLTVRWVRVWPGVGMRSKGEHESVVMRGEAICD